MNQAMNPDLKIIERMAFLHQKDDAKSLEEYGELQKKIVPKYKPLLDAMATAGLFTVCLRSTDKDEFIGWDVRRVVANGTFQLNTPIEHQNSNSVPVDKLLKEITAKVK